MIITLIKVTKYKFCVFVYARVLFSIFKGAKIVIKKGVEIMEANKK